MAFDAHLEDYLRLSLHFAVSMNAHNPYEAARAANTFATTYQQARDSLEQTDADRAFWLVSRATDLVDYELPFSDEHSAPEFIGQVSKLLHEAIELDPECWDAQRMIAAGTMASPNDYAHYLAEHAAEVQESCENRCAEILNLDEEGICHPRHIGANQSMIEQDTEMMALACQLNMRPLARWYAAQASVQLLCGRYHLSIEAAKKALDVDPHDLADVSFTLALAYAKLEDEKALTELKNNHPQTHGEPWFDLAYLALMFKQGNFEKAEETLDKLLATYGSAELALTLQNDIPDGVFSRVLVEPNSGDELVLAVSEATVIIQEGCDIHERGTLGSWIADQIDKRHRSTAHVQKGSAS